jgi:hypothetical protein
MTEVTANVTNEPHPHVPMSNTKDKRGGGKAADAGSSSSPIKERRTTATASVLVAADSQNYNTNKNVSNPNDYTIMMIAFLRWMINWMGTMFKNFLFGGAGQQQHHNANGTQSRDTGNKDHNRLRCRLGDTTNLAQLAMTSTLEPRPYTYTNGNPSYDEEERSHRGNHGHGHNNIDSSPRNNKIDSSPRNNKINNDRDASDDDDDDDESSFDRYNSPVKGHFDHSIMAPNGTYQQVSPYRDDGDDASRTSRCSNTSSSDGNSSQRRIGELRYLNNDCGSNSEGEYPHANYNDNFSSSDEDCHSSFEGGGNGYDDSGHVYNHQNQYDDNGQIILQASHPNRKEQEEGYGEVQLPPDFQHGVVYVPHMHANILSPLRKSETSHQAQDTTIIPTGSYQTHLPSDSNVCSTELSRMLQAQHWTNAAEFCQNGIVGGKFKERDVRTKVDVHIPKLGKCQTLPLHLACLYQPPLTVVQALVDLYAEAASVRIQEEACNQLPLHLACMLGGSLGVIQVLLDAYPLGVKCRESFGGFLPLHLAVHSTTSSTGTSLETIETLIQAFPESLHVVCNFGDTPLDIVQKGNHNLKDKHKVKALLHKYLDKLPPPIQVRHLIQDIDIGTARVGGGSRIHILGVMKLKHCFPNKHVPSSIRKSTKTVLETYVTISIPASEGETKEWYVRDA